MLLGGCAAKFARVLRVGSLDAGLGPTALFPLRLRRPIAMATCAAEFGCGVGLIVTAGTFGRGEPANAVRFLTALLFIVATCALIELRTSQPGHRLRVLRRVQHGPGQRAHARPLRPAGGRRAGDDRAAAAAPAAPGPGGRPAAAILAAELIVIAALSPELGEALVRLGYSEPCELRGLPAVRGR